MKTNVKIIDLIAALNDHDKLLLYDFILRLRSSNTINQVYYTSKKDESQAANDKKSKICSITNNDTNRNS